MHDVYADKARQRTCAACGAGQSERPIIRFRLAVALGSGTQRGAGAMNLCEPCWRRLRSREKAPFRAKCSRTT